MFLKVCIALSTVLLPVCNRGVQYSICMFRLLQSPYILSILKAPPISDFIFSGIPYKVKFFVRKFLSFRQFCTFHNRPFAKSIYRHQNLHVTVYFLFVWFSGKVDVYFLARFEFFYIFRDDNSMFDILYFYLMQGRRYSLRLYSLSPV